MKTLLLFLFFLMCLSADFAVAQNKFLDAKSRSTVEQTSVLFEGEVVSTRGYPDPENKNLYFSSVVKVNKVIKGKISAELVRISYRGPRIVKVEGGKAGEYIVAESDDSEYSSSLPKQTTMLFFCRALPNGFVRDKENRGNKEPEFEMIGLSTYHPVDGVNSTVGGKFANKQDLYEYLNDNYNITSPAVEKAESGKPLGSAAQESSRKEMAETEKYIRDIRQAIELRRSQSANTTGQRPTGTESLVFTIQNPITTGNSIKYLEYDIYVKSTTSGSAYLATASMDFSYNTSAFGNSIVSNGRVTVTAGSAFSNPTYKVPVFVDNSSATPSFRVAIRTEPTTSNFNRTRVTSTPIQLFHVKIEVSNCQPSSGIAFTNQEDRAFYNLYTTTASAPENTTYEFFQPVTYTDYAGGFSSCIGPVITGFNTQIKAGTGAVLTVTGSGFFGNRGSSGQLQLKDADVGGSAYLTLDDLDYLLWSDTQIQIRLPSVVTRGATVGKFGTPGSGNIRVVTNPGSSVESASALNVDYALDQFVNVEASTGNINRKSFYRLAKNNCVDGFTFRVDTGLKNIPGAVKCIETALAVWSVRLGINLTLDKNSTGQLVTAIGGANNDGISTIFFESFNGIESLTQMRTYKSRGELAGDKFAPTDIDIAINSGYNWDYSLGGSAQNFAFYDAILHELGHAIGVRHLVTPNVANSSQLELMYYNNPPNVSGSQRKTLVSGNGRSLAAAQDIITSSRATAWNSGVAQTLNSAGTSTCKNTKPVAPGLQVQANNGVGNSITLTWSKVYNATGYMIETSLDPVVGFTNYVPILSGNVSTYTTGNLDASTSYYFRIKATNSAGNSPYSNIANASTAARLNPSPLPSPTSLQVTTNSSPLYNLLTWSYPSSGRSFIITRSTDIGFSNSVSFTTGTDARNFSDSDVIAGTIYFYRVLAQYQGSQSDDVPPVSVTTYGCTPLGTVGEIMMAESILPYTNSFSFGIGAEGVVSYIWNFTSPNAQDQGWSLGGGGSSASASYQGNFPYTGSPTTVMVEMTSNCGTSTIRYLQLPTPTPGNGGGTESSRMSASNLTSKNGIVIYPNPSSDQLHIDLPEMWKVCDIRLVDIKTNKSVMEWHNDSLQINRQVSAIPAGIYIIEFSNSGIYQRMRVQITH